MAFVDLEKAFDNVRWNKLFGVLSMIGLKYKDERMIFNLYEKQVAIIRVEGQEMEAKIRKGARQGCSLSPLLLNIYIEEAVKKMKEKLDTELFIGRE